MHVRPLSSHGKMNQKIEGGDESIGWMESREGLISLWEHATVSCPIPFVDNRKKMRSNCLVAEWNNGSCLCKNGNNYNI
jgi:hypothetical protein